METNEERKYTRHYRFAHSSLPKFVFGRREEIDELLSRSEGALQLFLQSETDELWQRLGIDLGLENDADEPDEPEEFVDALLDGDIDVSTPISCEIVDVDSDTPGALVDMPPPSETGLAHLILVAFLDGQTRYFTLEHHVSPHDEGTQTMLCERKPDGEGGFSHVNLGDGPDPTAGAIVSSVREVVDG